jgi:hypothetical protein
VSCDEPSLGPSGILRVPWRQGVAEGAATHVVAVADGRGLVAVACYEVPVDGVTLAALGLLAPAFATPVMRGQARVRPGDPRHAAAPIALRARRGVVETAMGLALTPPRRRRGADRRPPRHPRPSGGHHPDRRQRRRAGLLLTPFSRRFTSRPRPKREEITGRREEGKKGRPEEERCFHHTFFFSSSCLPIFRPLSSPFQEK